MGYLVGTKKDGDAFLAGGVDASNQNAANPQDVKRASGAWETVGATGGGFDQVFYENDQVITSDYTLTAGKNAMTAGDITINTGVTVSVPTGAKWTVI